jgi:carbon monoxide dehydrogenase subunit G
VQSFFEWASARRSSEGRSTEFANLCRWAVALALTFASPAGAADITWDQRQEDGNLVLQASALLDADVAAAWRVLTDYQRYGEFMPGVNRSAVRRDGGTVRVDQAVSVALCGVQLPTDIRWRIQETPPTALHSHGTASRMSIDSTYTLISVAAGVRLEYVGRIAESPALRFLQCAAVGQFMRADFTALTTEIERVFRLANANAAAPLGARRSHRRDF